MEIITEVERRRNWPLERKLAVLEEASRGLESAAKETSASGGASSAEGHGGPG